jgi:hypothetical protein
VVSAVKYFVVLLGRERECVGGRDCGLEGDRIPLHRIADRVSVWGWREECGRE